MLLLGFARFFVMGVQDEPVNLAAVLAEPVNAAVTQPVYAQPPPQQGYPPPQQQG